MRTLLDAGAPLSARVKLMDALTLRTSKLLNIDRLHGRPGNSGYPGILGQVEGIGGQRAGGFTATFAALGAILDGLHRGHRK